jgi:hypothetical protein
MRLTRQRLSGNIPRYIKQRDSYSCGPVAIVNYWKSIGLNANLSDIKIIGKIVGTDDYGTLPDQMEKIIGERFRSVKWGEFNRHLRSSRTAILDHVGHFFFIPCLLANRGKVGHVLVINNSDTYSTFTIKQMKWLLPRSQTLLCPVKRL